MKGGRTELIKCVHSRCGCVACPADRANAPREGAVSIRSRSAHQTTETFSLDKRRNRCIVASGKPQKAGFLRFFDISQKVRPIQEQGWGRLVPGFGIRGNDHQPLRSFTPDYGKLRSVTPNYGVRGVGEGVIDARAVPPIYWPFPALGAPIRFPGVAAPP